MTGKKRVQSGKRVRNLALKSVDGARGSSIRGGRDKSQANHSDMVVTKKVDKASTQFFKDAV